LILLLAGALPLAVGCGGSASDGFVATGRVTLDDAPVADAVVTLMPEGNTPGQGAFARTGADGSFKIAKTSSTPGIRPGTYKATVSKLVDAGGQPLSPDVPPMEAGGKEALPGLYANPTTSPLRCTVSPEGQISELRLKSTK